MRITQFYLQITPYLPLPRKHSPDGASPDWGCGHLIATTHLSTPKGWKAESAWLADLQQTVYPHKWSPVSCRSNAGQRKFTGQRPTFYHCATQPIRKLISKLTELKPKMSATADIRWHKLGVTVHRCLQGKAPQYLVNCCHPTSDITSRQRLRSSSRHHLVVPRHRRSMFGRRAFSVAGPMAWNALPDDLRDPSLSADNFQKKTHLFRNALGHLAH